MQIGDVDAFILHTYSRARLQATQRMGSPPGVGLTDVALSPVVLPKVHCLKSEAAFRN